MAIAFKPVQTPDLPLLARWMAEPHWREWWGEAEGELADICDMIDGRATTRPFIFTVNGIPTGYIQYWHVGHHQTPAWIARNPWLAEFPAQTIGVDISIGSADNLSRGTGSTVLRAFVERLRALGYEQIIIDPDPANIRAVRAYEKAGFRIIDALKGKYDDVLLMRHKC